MILKPLVLDDPNTDNTVIDKKTILRHHAIPLDISLDMFK
jgi:hypothetical protein